MSKNQSNNVSALVEELEQINPKHENGDACEFCGGYGFHPAGDIREHMIDARAVLAKYAGE